MVPYPLQAEQCCWTCWIMGPIWIVLMTTPLPLQSLQDCVPLPPFPWQASQHRDLLTGTFLTQPLYASSKVISRAFFIGLTLGICLCLGPDLPPPKNILRMSMLSWPATLVGGASSPIEPLGPVLVVDLPLVGIVEDFICLLYLVELFSNHLLLSPNCLLYLDDAFWPDRGRLS